VPPHTGSFTPENRGASAVFSRQAVVHVGVVVVFLCHCFSRSILLTNPLLHAHIVTRRTAAERQRQRLR
jgi:hypothetical protein